MSNQPAAGCCTGNHPPLDQHRRDLQGLALHIATADLQRDFSETFGVETIEQVLNSCYDQLAARATVPNFLPLFAERFARQRLNALAQAEGKISDGITRPASSTSPGPASGAGIWG
jgi:arsenate reductase (thioredoxin)